MKFGSIPIVCVFLLIATPLAASEIEGQVRTGPRVVTRGRVELFRDHLPLEDHLIGLNGRFEFRNLSIGAYSVRVHVEGFAEEEISVSVFRNNSRETVMIDLHPVRLAEEPAGSISVTEYQIPRLAKREFQQGLEDRKRGQCAKAIPHLQKAVQAFGQYGDAFNELGHCFQNLKDFEKAEESFKKAIEYSDTVYPSINLADLYESRKRFDDARAVLHQSMLKYPAEGDLDFALAHLYFVQDRIQEAEEAGLRAHLKVHRLADVHLLLAKIYSRIKKYSDVLTQLRLYLTENPKGPTADLVRKNLAEIQK